MELFTGGIVVRLQSIHNKYLVAKDDEKRVSQHRDGSLASARWTVEAIINVQGDPRLRFKSCYGCYLISSWTKRACLGLSGKEVFQDKPDHLNARVEWRPFRDGFHVLLMCYFGHFLKAHAASPPWRNSVTVSRPASCTHTSDWYLWHVEILEGQEQPPLPRPSQAAESSGSFPAEIDQESPDGIIEYNIADDVGNVDANGWRKLNYSETNVSKVTSKLKEVTGLDDIYVCTWSAVHKGLVPHYLYLPIAYKDRKKLVVVDANSTLAKTFTI